MTTTITTTPFNLREAIAAVADTACSYRNGGWIKTVTGLDKTKNNGYSIQGKFVEKTGLSLYQPGLYLLCDVQGSRRNHKKNYVLVRFDGKNVELIKELPGGGRDWALRLWPAIESAIADPDIERKAAIEQVKQLCSKYQIKIEDLI